MFSKKRQNYNFRLIDLNVAEIAWVTPLTQCKSFTTPGASSRTHVRVAKSRKFDAIMFGKQHLSWREDTRTRRIKRKRENRKETVADDPNKEQEAEESGPPASRGINYSIQTNKRQASERMEILPNETSNEALVINSKVSTTHDNNTEPEHNKETGSKKRSIEDYVNDIYSREYSLTTPIFRTFLETKTTYQFYQEDPNLSFDKLLQTIQSKRGELDSCFRTNNKTL
ncbi:hypothetical protein ACJJTC_012886 [Scirpophaga incertulas]